MTHTYKGIPPWITADFSSETMEAGRKWHNIFPVLQENEQYPVKLSFRSEGKNKDILR